jgi:hypothetical protein
MQPAESCRVTVTNVSQPTDEYLPVVALEFLHLGGDGDGRRAGVEMPAFAFVALTGNAPGRVPD